MGAAAVSKGRLSGRGESIASRKSTVALSWCSTLPFKYADDRAIEFHRITDIILLPFGGHLKGGAARQATFAVPLFWRAASQRIICLRASFLTFNSRENSAPLKTLELKLAMPCRQWRSYVVREIRAIKRWDDLLLAISRILANTRRTTDCCVSNTQQGVRPARLGRLSREADRTLLDRQKLR